MVYVLDTNIFRELLMHYPKKGAYHEHIWDLLDQNIEAGNFISVDECYNELEKQFSKDAEMMLWIKAHKGMFKNPTDEESIIISELFQNKKFQESIHLKNILQNRPSADAYLVAKAKSQNAIIVTTESFKPNSAQIPNLCLSLGVECIDFDDFMAIVGNE